MSLPLDLIILLAPALSGSFIPNTNKLSDPESERSLSSYSCRFFSCTSATLISNQLITCSNMFFLDTWGMVEKGGKKVIMFWSFPFVFVVYIVHQSPLSIFFELCSLSAMFKWFTWCGLPSDNASATVELKLSLKITAHTEPHNSLKIAKT